MNPRGEVVSSGLTWWMVQTGIHFPHLMQSSLVAVKLKMSSGVLLIYLSLCLYYLVIASLVLNVNVSLVTFSFLYCDKREKVTKKKKAQYLLSQEVIFPLYYEC